MVANFLGLFFIILGMTGIPKSSMAEIMDFNSGFIPTRFNYPRNIEEKVSALCQGKNSPPYGCKNDEIRRLQEFGFFQNYKINGMVSTGHVPYFRNIWPIKGPRSTEYNNEFFPKDAKTSLRSKLLKVKSKYEINPGEYIDVIGLYAPSENSIKFAQHYETIERKSAEKSFSDNTENSMQKGSDYSYSVPKLDVADQTITDLQLSSESTKDVIIKDVPLSYETPKIQYETSLEPHHTYLPVAENRKNNLVEKENTSTIIESVGTDGIMEGSTFANGNSLAMFSNITGTEIMSKNDFTSVETDSTHEPLNSTSENNFNSVSASFSETYSVSTSKPAENTSSVSEDSNWTKKQGSNSESTVSQSFSSILTTKLASLEDTLSTSESTDWTNKQGSNSDSTESQSSSSFSTSKPVPLEDTSSISEGTEWTNKQGSVSDSIVSQSSSLMTGETIPLETKPSSSEEISPINTQNFETTPSTSATSTTFTNDNIDLQSESSPSNQIKSTSSKTSEDESSPKNIIPSSTLEPFPDVVSRGITKESFSTQSSSSKVHFTPASNVHDHIIEIPVIHTARVVITSLFLVIALIAITVLAVYIFRIRRKTIQYDQLLLIP